MHVRGLAAIVAIAASVWGQDKGPSLYEAQARTAKQRNYTFKISKSRDVAIDGDYVDGVLHVQSKRAEAVRRNNTRLAREKGQAWTDADTAARKDDALRALTELPNPTDIVTRLVFAARKIKSPDPLSEFTGELEPGTIRALLKEPWFTFGEKYGELSDLTGTITFLLNGDGLIRRIDLRATGKKPDTSATQANYYNVKKVQDWGKGGGPPKPPKAPDPDSFKPGDNPQNQYTPPEQITVEVSVKIELSDFGKTKLTLDEQARTKLGLKSNREP